MLVGDGKISIYIDGPIEVRAVDRLDTLAVATASANV